jgi:yersiniabactin nonribosomal peptide synthetase
VTISLPAGGPSGRQREHGRLDATWRQYLSAVPVALDLPADRARPPERAASYQAVTAAVPVDGRTVRAIEEAGGEAGWLAALAVLLSRYSGQSDLVIGSPAADGLAVGRRIDLTDDPAYGVLVQRARGAVRYTGQLPPADLDAFGAELHPDALIGERAAFGGGLVHGTDRRDWPGADLTLTVDTLTGDTLTDGGRVTLAGDAELFDPPTLRSIAANLGVLLAGCADGDGTPVSALELLAPAERRRVLVDGNATATEFADLRPWPERVAGVIDRAPEAPAVRNGDGVLSYGDLGRAASRLAHHLRAQGVRNGDRVGLFLERSPGAVIGTLAIARAGATVVLLDPENPGPRTAFMLADAVPPVVLTRSGLLSRLPASQAASAVCVDRDGTAIARRPDTDPAVGFAATSHVAYTSGSAGVPKAVAIGHPAVANLIAWTHRAYGLSRTDRASWLSSPGHAIGLMEWLPFLAAGAQVCIGDDRTAAAPDRLRDWLTDSGVTHTVLVTTVADRLCRLDWPERCGLQVMVAAGERLRTWPRADLPFKVAVGYGSTETGLVASSYDAGTDLRHTPCAVPEAERAASRPPVGRPIANVRAYVLDRHRRPVPVGAAGELYVAGTGLSGGYPHDPSSTAERFVPNPLPEEPGHVLYRTGDLARYRTDGLLEVLGRADGLLRVDGHRVETGEVEAIIAEQDGVRETVVVGRAGEDGRTVLVGYVVADGWTPDSLRRRLRSLLPTAMVPTRIVLLDAVPRLPNGKVDRHSLPEPADEPADEPAVECEAGPTDDADQAPDTGLLDAVAGLFAEVLRRDRVGPDEDLAALGGGPLVAAAIAARVDAEWGVTVPPTEIGTATDVATMVAAAADEPAGTEQGLPTVVPNPDDRYEPFGLTETQQAYWIGRTDAVELGGVGCHGYWEWESDGLEPDRFDRAWRRLVDRHEMLRTVIRPDGTQRLLAEVPDYGIPRLDLRDETPERADRRAGQLRDELSHHVFPADRWPLWDVRLTLLPGGRVRIHLSFDLLIIDAWSYFQILVPDLVSLYEDPEAELEPLELTFRDYVVATTESVERSAPYRRSRAYWLERLDDLPAAPDLPRAPATASRESGPARFTRLEHQLPAEDWARMKTRANALGLTPAGVVVAAFAEVLRAWSKNDQFTINFPLFNRLPVHEQVDKIIGDFTTTSLLAVEKADGTFAERARALQERLWTDLEHRHFGGVQVMRELARRAGEAIGATYPVVVTSLLGQPPRRFTTSLGEAVHTSTQTPQVTLDFQVSEVEGGLHLSWDHIAEVFPPGLVRDMFAAYVRVLDRLAGEDGDHDEAGEQAWHVERFPLVPAEQLAVRERVNDTAADFRPMLLHQPVATHAREAPDSLAVVAGGRRLTYAELSRRVNQVGRALRAGGARPNQLVGIVMDRGWEQIVAAHGVLAAGAAYLPIDPGVPAERLAYLLAHGEVDTVLTQDVVDARLDWPDGVTRHCVERDFDDVDPRPIANAQQPTDLAYVIYTSGSTGKPKGVMVDHRGAANTICDINGRFGTGRDDACLAVSGLHFDLSVYDVFGMIAAGGTVVMPEPAANPDPARWAELVAAEGVTFWNSVPTLLDILVSAVEGDPSASLDSIRLVILAGDWIPLTLPDRLRAQAPDVQVIGSGGPTESCVWSVIYPIGEVHPSWTSIPYGTPMSNQRYHVLDARGEHRPVWVPGEIHIESQVGLARGYWRDPERTDAAFFVLPSTGGRVYASGDIGRYLPDGTIEILGRDDFQVKIQGHRIELGEVEATLAEHPGVDRAVVVAAGASRDSRRLAAYVTATVTATGAEPPAPVDLQHFVADRLPPYMVPVTVTVLDALPLTGNGKVDRKALSSTGDLGDAETAYAPPEGPLEELVAAQWAELLELDQVGRHDHFFRLGGTSIVATRFVARVRETFGAELSLRTVFAQPTVAEVCAALAADPDAGEPVVAIAETLAQLTDDDVDQLMSAG